MYVHRAAPRKLSRSAGLTAFLLIACLLGALLLSSNSGPVLAAGEPKDLLVSSNSRPVLAAGEPKDMVAQLGTIRLMASDLRDYVLTLGPEARRQALANPQIANRLVQLEMVRRALLDEAAAKKWGQRPDVAKQINAARDAILLKTYLAATVNMPPDYPSDKDIQATYDLNRDKFLLPRQYRLEQIFLVSPPGDKNAEAVRRKAQDLVNKARAGSAKFEDLARQNSQHKPSAARGGDTGWLMETEILPELQTRIMGMAQGEIGDPVHTSQGWHIVRLMDTKPAAPKPLAEVRSLIVASLREKKQQDEEQQYIAHMLQKTPVTVNEPKLRAVLEAVR